MNLSPHKYITFFSNNFWTLYKFREDAIKLFIKNGYKVNLIGKYDGFEQKFSDNNIKKYNLSIDERGYNPIKELALFINIFLLYKKIPSDIFYHYTIKPNLYGSISARLLNYRYISFITGLGSLFIKSKSFLRKLAIILYRISLKKSDEIWFTNNSDLNDFVSYKIISPRIKTRIVPGCGVSTAFFYPQIKQINKKNILMIARLQSEKGVNEYLHLANKYKNLGYNFTIVGSLNSSDPSRIKLSTLESLVSDKIISYIPFVSNVLSLYDSADCFILPSYREGLSTVLVEAASRKIPIITTNVPGCIDVIPNESYGFLCNPRDKDSLCEAFDRYIHCSNERITNMINKTHDHAYKNFSKDVILSHYSSKIKDLC
jgi:glycosyltransferase involved in cell wall biosynthesis|tara:strand:- start:22920 stop:24038 length:1119 start_codon:yes stop_codon:yes gene_type:complete